MAVYKIRHERLVSINVHIVSSCYVSQPFPNYLCVFGYRKSDQSFCAFVFLGRHSAAPDRRRPQSSVWLLWALHARLWHSPQWLPASPGARGRGQSTSMYRVRCHCRDKEMSCIHLSARFIITMKQYSSFPLRSDHRRAWGLCCCQIKWLPRCQKLDVCKMCTFFENVIPVRPLSSCSTDLWSVLYTYLPFKVSEEPLADDKSWAQSLFCQCSGRY